MPRRITLAAVIAASVMTLSACGGSDPLPSGDVASFTAEQWAPAGPTTWIAGDTADTADVTWMGERPRMMESVTGGEPKLQLIVERHHDRGVDTGAIVDDYRNRYETHALPYAANIGGFEFTTVGDDYFIASWYTYDSLVGTHHFAGVWGGMGRCVAYVDLSTYDASHTSDKAVDLMNNVVATIDRSICD